MKNMIIKPIKSGLAPVLLCAALTGTAGIPAEKNKDQQPNIIFILTDDQRWDALGLCRE
jgi:hypothetical protein